MNIYHPIIQACLMYFKEKEDKNNTSFCYAIKSDNNLTQGNAYYLAVYRLKVTRKVAGVPKSTESLLPIVYDIHGEQVIQSEELTDYIFAQTQKNGIEHNAENRYVNTELIQDIRIDFAETISKTKSVKLAEMKLEIDSDRKRNEQQTIEYYNSIIRNQEGFIKNWQFDIELNFEDEKRVKQLQNVITLAQGRIKKYESERDEKLQQIREISKIDISDEIISLNLIKII
jgi:hypothetical protein